MRWSTGRPRSHARLRADERASAILSASSARSPMFRSGSRGPKESPSDSATGLLLVISHGARRASDELPDHQLWVSEVDRLVRAEPDPELFPAIARAPDAEDVLPTPGALVSETLHAPTDLPAEADGDASLHAGHRLDGDALRHE